MHFRKSEKSKFFGKRVERGMFPNHLGCKAHQFQRLLLAMQHLLQNILKTLKVPNKHYFNTLFYNHTFFQSIENDSVFTRTQDVGTYVNRVYVNQYKIKEK